MRVLDNKYENAYLSIEKEIEETLQIFNESIKAISDDQSLDMEDTYIEASTEFIVAANKTYTKIMRVLQTFIREINTTYTKQTAKSDTKKVIDELAAYCLVHGGSSAGDVIGKKKVQIKSMYISYLSDLLTLVSKNSISEINLEKKDIIEEKLTEMCDKYADSFEEMEENFDEEARHMSVTQNTVDAVAKELDNFTHFTKEINNSAVDSINKIYKYINASNDSRFITFACQVANKISLFSQKITLYYVRYPFKVMSVLRKKIKNIPNKDKEND